VRHLVETAQDSLVLSYYRWQIAREMEPLCRQALNDRSITAWVCSDDYESLAVLSFLTRNGIHVPGEISLVGFNNCAEALENNLTSYSSNIEMAFGLMLDHVARPEWSRNRRAVKPFTFQGSLIERGTTGPGPFC
jgi:DNA-binding LacI/PurR family transcriptional regulator